MTQRCLHSKVTAATIYTVASSSNHMRSNRLTCSRHTHTLQRPSYDNRPSFPCSTLEIDLNPLHSIPYHTIPYYPSLTSSSNQSNPPSYQLTQKLPPPFLLPFLRQTQPSPHQSSSATPPSRTAYTRPPCGSPLRPLRPRANRPAPARSRRSV